MKIVILGPVLPFKSGIARHTTAIAQTFRKERLADVSAYSFSRQFPARLYPGEEQKNLALQMPAGIPTFYNLDAVNPLTWLRVAKKIRAENPDFIIIPAWTFFVAPCLGFIAKSLRSSGFNVVVVVHNAVDHEVAAWKSFLSRWQLKQSDGFITHNSAIAKQLEDMKLSQPVEISPHPIYDDYPSPTNSLAKEAALELLFFGLVRPYKGLDIMLEALSRLESRNIRLTIAGEFWEGYEETLTLIDRLGISDQVGMLPRYVTDEEAAELFARCDAVVTPYKTASGSGVIALAQYYCKPIIASDIPSLTEAVTDGQNGWIFKRNNVEDLTNLLRDRVTRENAENMNSNIQHGNTLLSWKVFAQRIVALAGNSSKL